MNCFDTSNQFIWKKFSKQLSILYALVKYKKNFMVLFRDKLFFFYFWKKEGKEEEENPDNRFQHFQLFFFLQNLFSFLKFFFLETHQFVCSLQFLDFFHSITAFITDLGIKEKLFVVSVWSCFYELYACLY